LPLLASFLEFVILKMGGSFFLFPASRHRPFDEPPPYEAIAAGYDVAPPYYYDAPPKGGVYGWAPPYKEFPERPEANTVYMMSAPPPYPGIGGYGAPSAPFAVPADGYYYLRPAEPGFADPSTNVAFVPAAPPYVSQRSRSWTLLTHQTIFHHPCDSNFNR
jgi:hypothetical protein